MPVQSPVAPCSCHCISRFHWRFSLGRLHRPMPAGATPRSGGTYYARVLLAGLSSRRPGRYRTRHRCASYLEPCAVSLQLETPGPRYSLCFCRSCALRALELSRDHLLHSSCSKRPPSPPRILVPAERSNVTQRDDRRRINFCRPHVVGARCRG